MSKDNDFNNSENKKRLKLSDIFDEELVLKDGNFWYDLEFDGHILEQPEDYPITAVLKKGKRITKKEVFK
ncbi:hypothetical protein [Methanobrevibacter sp. V74]|uniref:hypothetical protein n=1 Tax=Methanobrevibacter sp. V74 TaxID=3064279 RepID=UPI0027376CAD|nr:hypothetical protein [Methanobrevibacter sp. V74]